MKNKRFKKVLIRKSDIKQIVIYPEETILETTFFGKRVEKTINPAKSCIFCELSKDRVYWKIFKSDSELYDWFENIKEQLANNTDQFILIETFDL